MLLDNGLGLDWPHVAVRNWEQYGLLHLHGKMVINPGGFRAETNPEIYRGHRPPSLYPVFLCHWLFATLGAGDFGFVAYDAAVAAMVLLSIWWLAGRTERAFWLASIAVITPGFVRWQTSLDPNLTAVLFGFPFCAALVALLRRPAWNWRHVAALFTLILLFSMLNWTTVFVHGMLFVTLLALRGVPRRHLIAYVGLTAAMAGGVLITSVASKMTQTDGSSAGLASMLQGYGWGNVGYGQDMTTRVAILRLLAANTVGLLPVLVYLGSEWWRRRGQTVATGLFYLLPVMMVAVELLVLRNYFGHHPWMSVHFVLLAIILAAVIWKDRAGGTIVAGQTGLPTRVSWLVAACAYSFVVLFAARVHNGQELAFAAMLRRETARDSTIVIRRDTDPALAEVSERLSRLTDRRFVVAQDSADPALAGASLEKAVFLSSVVPAQGRILVEKSLIESPAPLVGPLLNWYSGHVAQRREGDQLKVPGDTFFLYEGAN